MGWALSKITHSNSPGKYIKGPWSTPFGESYYRSVINKGASKDFWVPSKILNGGSAWHFQTDKQNELGSDSVHAVQHANITLIWSYLLHCTWVPRATQTCPANSDFRSTLINFHAGFFYEISNWIKIWVRLNWTNTLPTVANPTYCHWNIIHFTNANFC